MVRCGDDDRVAREIVGLHKEQSRGTLDLPGLVHVIAFLAHGDAPTTGRAPATVGTCSRCGSAEARDPVVDGPLDPSPG